MVQGSHGMDAAASLGCAVSRTVQLRNRRVHSCREGAPIARVANCCLARIFHLRLSGLPTAPSRYAIYCLAIYCYAIYCPAIYCLATRRLCVTGL